MKIFYITMSILATLLLVCLFAIGAIISQANAHDWFTGTHDPVTQFGCCGGNDCKEVPDDMMAAGVITEVPGGYEVRLTAEQANYFNKYARSPITAMVKGTRAQPSKTGGYALCIVPGSVTPVQCLFVPQNT